MTIKFNTLNIPITDSGFVREITVLNTAHVAACSNDYNITIIRIVDDSTKIIDTISSDGARVGDVAMSNDSHYLAISYPDINLGRGSTKLFKYSHTYGKYLQICEIFSDHYDITMTRSGHSMVFIDMGEALDLYITSESYIFHRVTITSNGVFTKEMRCDAPGLRFIPNVNASPLIPCITPAAKNGYGDLHIGDKRVWIDNLQHGPKDIAAVEAIGRNSYCFTTPTKLIVGGPDKYDTFNIGKLIQKQIKQELKKNPPQFDVAVPDVCILDMAYRASDRRLVVLHAHPLTRDHTLGVTHLSDLDTQGHPPLETVNIPSILFTPSATVVDSIAQINGKLLVASHSYCAGTLYVSLNLES